MDRLPPEILSIVVGYADAATAINFMSASQTMWEVGARGFYRELHLNKLQVRLLFSGGRQRDYVLDVQRGKFFRFSGITSSMPYEVTSKDCFLPDRTRRALRYTRHLAIDGPLAVSDHHMIWAAGIDATVFPNLCTLRLTNRDVSDPDWHSKDPYYTTGTLFGPSLKQICVHGPAADSLLTLSFSKHKHPVDVYVHHSGYSQLGGGRLSPFRSCNLCRSFKFVRRYQYRSAINGLKKEEGGAGTRPPLQYVLPATAFNIRGLDKLKARGEWDPQTSRIDFCCEDEPEPCQVCGQRWMYEDGTARNLSKRRQ